MQHRTQSDLEQADFTSTGSLMKSPEGRVFGYGKTVGNGIENWAPGAHFLHTDGAAGAQFYINEGTKTTASWVLAAGGSLLLDDDEYIDFGTGNDVRMLWNGSYLEVAPNTGFWSNCPFTKYANGHSLAYEFFDDFTDHLVGAAPARWLTAVVGTESSAAGDGAGGSLLLTNDATTDNSAIQAYASSESFLLAAGKHLWFEARVKCAAGATQVDVAMGLSASEDLTAVADNMAQDGVVIHKDDGATTLKFTASKNGTNTGQNTDIGTMTTGWHTYGFYVNGVTSITPYFDGTADTAITATLPDDEVLAPFFLVRNGDATTTQTLEIDYVKVVQLR